MKWLLSSASILAFVYASSGFAADMQAEALVKAPPAWSWAGFCEPIALEHKDNSDDQQIDNPLATDAVEPIDK